MAVALIDVTLVLLDFFAVINGDTLSFTFDNIIIPDVISGFSLSMSNPYNVDEKIKVVQYGTGKMSI